MSKAKKGKNPVVIEVKEPAISVDPSQIPQRLLTYNLSLKSSYNKIANIDSVVKMKRLLVNRLRVSAEKHRNLYLKLLGKQAKYCRTLKLSKARYDNKLHLQDFSASLFKFLKNFHRIRHLILILTEKQSYESPNIFAKINPSVYKAKELTILNSTFYCDKRKQDFVNNLRKIPAKKFTSLFEANRTWVFKSIPAKYRFHHAQIIDCFNFQNSTHLFPNAKIVVDRIDQIPFYNKFKPMENLRHLEKYIIYVVNIDRKISNVFNVEDIQFDFNQKRFQVEINLDFIADTWDYKQLHQYMQQANKFLDSHSEQVSMTNLSMMLQGTSCTKNDVFDILHTHKFRSLELQMGINSPANLQTLVKVIERSDLKFLILELNNVGLKQNVNGVSFSFLSDFCKALTKNKNLLELSFCFGGVKREKKDKTKHVLRDCVIQLEKLYHLGVSCPVESLFIEDELPELITSLSNCKKLKRFLIDYKLPVSMETQEVDDLYKRILNLRKTCPITQFEFHPNKLRASQDKLYRDSSINNLSKDSHYWNIKANEICYKRYSIFSVWN